MKTKVLIKLNRIVMTIEDNLLRIINGIKEDIYEYLIKKQNDSLE